jgi:type IV secretion system protein VirB9
MTVTIRRTALLLFACTIFTILGCVSRGGKPPPIIALDDTPSTQRSDVPVHVVNNLALEKIPPPVVEVPKLLPLPGQLHPVTPDSDVINRIEPDPRVRVAQANEDALVPPSRDGFINAIQVWPYSDGALYQLYASPGRVSVIALQPGEGLVSVSSGDTARWIVSDTSSGSNNDKRVQILVKPTRADLKTNMVITTDRRTYLLDMVANPSAWMASVSWSYPLDKIAALRNAAAEAQFQAPLATGLALEQLNFRYAVSGDSPPWRPLRAFDDGTHVYIQFPTAIAQGELPPLFVVGSQGDAQLINYRFRAPYYIVDRLFGTVELRLGGEKADVVRIARTDNARSPN